jgi:glycine/D-amino acid oxidase-like deaminating enzyme/nitrite reductase/ring-hydroxylating ferredoxin subunit
MIDQSLWRAGETPARYRADQIPDQVDVVIIGAGMTGLTSAYLLKQSGKRVAVFERERIGSGETGNTSAHVTHVTDMRLTALVDRFGRDAARRIWDGGDAAIDLIESNVDACDIRCGFQRVPGFLCSPFTAAAGKDDADLLRSEASLARELGFFARYSSPGPVTGKPAVAYADQALVHPLQYLAGLAAAVNGDGSVVCEMAEVGEVMQDPLAVIVNGKTVACDDVIIATHVPLTGSTGLVSALLFQTKLYPHSSYVLGARIDDDALAPGLYFDLSDPYYFLRVHEQQGARYAVFGGNDHKTGQETDTDARFASLELTLMDLVPSAKIERRWSGQVIETVDGLPFIGQTADHQYVATGYAGNGLTFGTLAGMMMRDAVMGLPNPWKELFDPNRKPTSIGAMATGIGENLDYPYYFIADRLRRDRKDGVDSIAPGDGKVLTIGGKPVACHRTSTGTLIKVSAVCTHLGCLVRWNGAESTWDCPCHGSRFTTEGLVIGGPAEAPLERLDNATDQT